MTDHPMLCALKSLSLKQKNKLKYDFAHGGRKLKFSSNVGKEDGKSLMKIREKDVKNARKLATWEKQMVDARAKRMCKETDATCVRRLVKEFGLSKKKK